MPTFDLQSHSTRSDGTLEPAEVVRAAAAAGVELLALTDHDTVEGVAEAIAAGEQCGVRVVPGTELSSIDGEDEDLHVCGYLVDHESTVLLDALEQWREDRFVRGERMVAALEELGWSLDRSVLDARRAAGRPIGRPHIAQAAYGHPANTGRIADEGLSTFSDLLVAYLIPGAPAYRRRTVPTVAQAIDVIHAAGGVAVWAHPFWDVEDPQTVLETVDRFASWGLDGVEVFYVTHTPEQIELLARHCAERGLLTTGSADFHGPDHPHFSAFATFELHGHTPDLGPIAQATSTP